MIALSFPSINYRYNVRFVRQTAYLLLLATLLRFFYLLRNFSYFDDQSFVDLAWAFATGIRFDMAILAALMSPLFLFYNLPWKTDIIESRPVRLITKIWLMLVVLVVVTPAVIDTELRHFTGRRLTFSLIHNLEDINIMALPMLTQYWYLTLLAIALSVLVIYAVLAVGDIKVQRRFGFFSWCLWYPCLLLALGLTIRGGVQGRPLRPQHSIVINHSLKGALLAVNSTHSLLTSYDARTLDPIDWFPNEAVLDNKLKQSQIFSVKQPEFDNVIIFILESIGKDNLKSTVRAKSNIPFIESLGDQGLLFENNFANGSISMMAINSITASLPPLNLGALAYSGYSDTKVNGLPYILKKYGYSSVFLHGGPRGVFFFDTMARNAGFDRYLSRDEFKGEAQLKTYWGIDDDSYLQYMARELEHMKTPFVASVFTLSNHCPYEVPDSYRHDPNYVEATGQELGARFTDYAVKNFFHTIEKYPWYKHTLFVFTGDHPAHEDRDPNIEKALPVYYQMVPLVFYHPSKKLGLGRSLKITQQVDIVPSVLDFLGVGVQEKMAITPFGHSVFQKDIPGRAFYGFENGEFFFITGDKLTTFNKNTGVKQEVTLKSELIRFDAHEMVVPSEEQDLQIRGMIQYFTNGIIGNNLYPTGSNRLSMIMRD